MNEKDTQLTVDKSTKFETKINAAKKGISMKVYLARLVREDSICLKRRVDLNV